jgi:hypothetical protein
MTVAFTNRLAQSGISYSHSSPASELAVTGLLFARFGSLYACPLPELCSFVPIFPLRTLLLVPLSSLEYFQMPRLLRKHLLCVSDETGTGFVLDFVLGDDRGFLGLDDAGTAVTELGCSVEILVLVTAARDVYSGGSEGCAPSPRRNVLSGRCRGLGLLDCALGHVVRSVGRECGERRCWQVLRAILCARCGGKLRSGEWYATSISRGPLRH